MSPTARTLIDLRKCGYVADIVERWIAQAGVRKDFLGCIDIIAVSRREPGVLAIQATTLSHLGARLTKARSKPELKVWLRAGGRFEVWGWALRAGRWQVKRVAVLADGLEDVVVKTCHGDRGRRGSWNCSKSHRLRGQNLTNNPGVLFLGAFLAYASLGCRGNCPQGIIIRNREIDLPMRLKILQLARGNYENREPITQTSWRQAVGPKELSGSSQERQAIIRRISQYPRELLGDL